MPLEDGGGSGGSIRIRGRGGEWEWQWELLRARHGTVSILSQDKCAGSIKNQEASPKGRPSAELLNATDAWNGMGRDGYARRDRLRQKTRKRDEAQ